MQELHGNTAVGYRQVNLSVGDICDRWTIARIKERKLESLGRLNECKEVGASRQMLEEAVQDIVSSEDPTVVKVLKALEETNLQLWAVEDACRDHVQYMSLFVDHAKDVLELNKKRSQLKAAINILFSGGELDEVKLYGKEESADAQNS